MKEPRISIVLPNYNYARFLPTRVESILAQTFTDYELIIIDDGSSDESAEVIRQYSRDPRVSTLFHPRNGGWAYRRWNEGVKLARAHYLWIPGADDSSDPTFLEKMTDLLEDDPSLEFAQCDSVAIDDQGAVLKPSVGQLFGDRWTKSFVGNWESMRTDTLKFCHVVTFSGVLLRTEAYRRLGGLKEKFRYCADWKFWIDLIREGKFAYHEGRLNFFRAHPQTIRARSERNWDEVKEGLEIIGPYFSELNRSEKKSLAEYWGQKIAEKTTAENQFQPKSLMGVLYDAYRLHPPIVAVALRSLPRRVASAIKWRWWKQLK